MTQRLRATGSVTRRLAFRAVALSLAYWIAPLGCLHALPAEPTQKAVGIGFVGLSSPTAPGAVGAFWSRLRELDCVESRNLVIEARWAEGNYDRLHTLMADLVHRKVDVLVTTATLTIPQSFSAPMSWFNDCRAS